MDPAGSVSTDLVLDALERVTTSPALRRSPQLISFLSYVVREELAGRGNRIKSYTIATDALGRPSCFDPARDPIVRVEARRLRSELDAYYSGPGSADPVRITVPTGSYRPQFTAQLRNPESEPQRRATGSDWPALSSSAIRRPILPRGASQWLLLALGLAWLANIALLMTVLVMLQQQRAEIRELVGRDAAEKTTSDPS
jgi:hypothetical protein